MNQPQRLYALDNLRAAVMWLGIVLHVSLNHLTATNTSAPWHDRATSVVADLTLLFIHAFRMPVFFILAGFFVAMLVEQRGYAGMLKHRLRRIGLPFLIFWLPLVAGTIVLVMLYVHMMVYGTPGFDPTIMPHDSSHPAINTMHMWFLYYLLWFCALTALLGRLGKFLPDAVKTAVSRAWHTLATHWWGFLVLAIPLGLLGELTKIGLVQASGSFMPHFDEIIQNGIFFAFGCYLYPYRETVLQRYAKSCWLYAAAGMFFFIVFLGLSKRFQGNPEAIPYIKDWLAFSYGCASWLWSFALIGAFLRYLPTQNRLLRYLSDSSYWVYLVHMLGTIGFGVLLYNAPFNALTKMLINISATTATCLLTYQLLVRYTAIGTLLNGRRLRLGQKQGAGKEMPAV
ncbi:MAG: acyltransferase family protein [Pseudomonadota bacterium]